jgi:signal transduction histidine kinase
VGNLDRHGNKGHGIGLSTVKKLVTSLDGDISVTSELNKGATFNFSVSSKN